MGAAHGAARRATYDQGFEWSFPAPKGDGGGVIHGFGLNLKVNKCFQELRKILDYLDLLPPLSTMQS